MKGIILSILMLFLLGGIAQTDSVLGLWGKTIGDTGFVIEFTEECAMPPCADNSGKVTLSAIPTNVVAGENALVETGSFHEVDNAVYVNRAYFGIRAGNMIDSIFGAIFRIGE